MTTLVWSCVVEEKETVCSSDNGKASIAQAVKNFNGTYSSSDSISEFNLILPMKITSNHLIMKVEDSAGDQYEIKFINKELLPTPKTFTCSTFTTKTTVNFTKLSKEYKYSYCGILHKKDYLSPGIGGHIPQAPHLCTGKTISSNNSSNGSYIENIWVSGANKIAQKQIGKILEQANTSDGQYICGFSNAPTPNNCYEGCSTPIERIEVLEKLD